MIIHVIPYSAAAAAAKSLQSCPTLCGPTDVSPPGSPVPGILQARTLEWVAISFSSAWKWKVKGKSLSRVQLLATPWTAAYQAPPPMGLSRQEYWSGFPSPSPIFRLLFLFHSGWLFICVTVTSWSQHGCRSSERKEKRGASQRAVFLHLSLFIRKHIIFFKIMPAVFLMCQ